MVDDRPRRILVLVPSLTAGGAERMVVNLLRELDRSAWRPVLATFTGELDYTDEMPDDVRRFELGKSSRLDNLTVVFRLARLIRRMQPDLIFTRIYFCGLVAFFARRLARNCAPIVAAIDTTLSRAIQDEPLLRVRRPITAAVLRRLERVVAISGACRADLVEYFGVPPEKCPMIYNGVDVSRIRELMEEPLCEPEWDTEVPMFVSVGRLTRAKNYPLLIRAFARVRQTHGAQLLILGEGEERERLERLVRDLDLEDAVSMPGFRANPFKYIRAASAFVMSSDWEGLPMVLIEAMACGAPIISTRYETGAEELVEHGENGLLVPRGDTEALAGAMERVIDDPNLRARLGRGAEDRAWQFDNARVVGKYEEVFRDALAER